MSKEYDTNPVNGFVNVYKSTGPTSMDIVRSMKRLTGQRKRVGHGGTLDPLAEGVLPVCFGQATRLMDYLIEGGKEYEMDIRLGITTATYDAEGEVTDFQEVPTIHYPLMAATINSFEGTIYQTPPMYSAIKIKGQRLYKLARSGIEVAREPRKVVIPKIDIIRFESPNLVLRVECHRGVYMRSLAHDIGQKLGCGAFITRLVRTKAGPFSCANSIQISAFEEKDGADLLKQHILPVEYPLLHMKSVTVNPSAAKYLSSGQGINLPVHINANAEYLEKFRAYSEEGVFLAVIKFDRGLQIWRPDMVFSLLSPSPYASEGLV